MKKLTEKQQKIYDYVDAAGRPVGMYELNRALTGLKGGMVPGQVRCIAQKGALVFVSDGGPRRGLAVDVPDRAEDYLSEEYALRPHATGDIYIRRTRPW